MQMVQSANVIEGLGIEGDKHASAASKRQVVLADKEALDAVGVLPGTSKENVTVEGVEVMLLPAGSLVRLGRRVVPEVTPGGGRGFLQDRIRTGRTPRLARQRGQ